MLFSKMLLVLHFIISLNLLLCCSQVVPDCPERGDTICLGHSPSRYSSSSGQTLFDILMDAYNQFCGCQYIQDNVAIFIGSNLPDADQPLVEANFSFLYHVREISGYLELNGIPHITRLSLPNLRIIRGNALRSNRYGLVVSGKIETLYMPMLTEISHGSVILIASSDMPYLCNIRSINWTDIAPFGPVDHRLTTNGCTDSDMIDCNALNCSSGFCWCNDSTTCCQTLSFNCDCNSSRCFRDGHIAQCCNTECAAGCSGGGNADQCRACKNVLDDGVCRERCPDREIYDPINDVFLPNSNFKFEAKPLCVSSCPDVLLELDTTCVESCPTNFPSILTQNGTKRCIPCDGQCPKVCVGRIFAYNQPGTYAGCQIIISSLRIQSIPFGANLSVLNDLNDVREIRGSLDISGFNGSVFPYLSNLKAVGTDSSQLLSQPCNSSSDTVKYSIIIADTSLASIDLSSLETVSGGGVRLENNTSLQRLDNLCYYLNNALLSSSCILNNHKSTEECVNITSIASNTCSSCVDLTSTPEASGSSVVLSTVDLIERSEIFEDDYQTLRRIARLETSDGTNQLTYRPYHYGGIWNINETIFNSLHINLAHGNGMWRIFGINWNSVKWEDLRKPIYSGLAARLFINQITGGASLYQTYFQANMWSNAYTSSQKTESDYLKLASELNSTIPGNITQIMGLGATHSIVLSTNEFAYFSYNFSKNTSLIEISLLVETGIASLYVSSIASPSDSLYCAHLKEASRKGHVYLFSNQLLTCGSNGEIFIGVVGRGDSIVTSAFLSLSDAQDSYNSIKNIGSSSEWFAAIGMYGSQLDAVATPLSVLITSDSPETFNVSIESHSGLILSDEVKSFKTTKFLIPYTYVVSNVSDIFNGLIVRAEEGHRVRVSVGYVSSDSYLALPLINFEGVSEYTYFAITPIFTSPEEKSQVLIVCGANDTMVTITPTETATVYLQNEGLRQIESSSNVTILAKRFQTILVESEKHLIGTKVVTSKPVAFLSGHQCISDSGSKNESCGFTIEQLPPTLNWGQHFIFSALPSSNVSYLSIVAAESNTQVNVSCTDGNGLEASFTISNPGEFNTLVVSPDDTLCSIVSDKPSLVAILGTSNETNDKVVLMALVQPIEQYSNVNYTFSVKSSSIMRESYLNLMVKGSIDDVFINNKSVIGQWRSTNKLGVEGPVYGVRLSLENDIYSISVKNGSTTVGSMMYDSISYGQLTATNLYLIHESSADLSVNITTHPTHHLPGSTATLTCFTTGLPVYAIHWMREGSHVYPSCKFAITSSSPESSALIIYNVSEADAGVYECIAHSYYSDPVKAQSQVFKTLVDTYAIPVVTPAIPNPTWSLKNENHCLSFIISNAVPNVTSNHMWWHYRSVDGQEMYLDPNMTAKYTFGSNHQRIMVNAPQLNDSGSYMLIVKNEAGIANSTISFNVYIAPRINSTPFNATKENGESITYTCIADGFPRPKITWTKDGVSLENSSRIRIISSSNGSCCSERLELMSTITLSDLNWAIDNGSYLCRANNAAQQEAVITEPFSLNVSSPEQTNFCSSNPCGQFGSCSSRLHTYYCTCHSGYTGDRCQHAVLAYVEPEFTETPRNTISELYSPVNLTCRAIGSPTPTILWFKDNELIPNNNDMDSVLVIPELRLSDRGFYHCEARVMTLHNGKTIRKTSGKALVTIRGVVQYEALVERTKSNEEILQQVRNVFNAESFPGNTKLLNVNINDINSTATHYSVIITLLTNQQPSSLLVSSLYDQLQNNPSIIVGMVERFDGCHSDVTTIPPHSNRTELNVTIIWEEAELGSDIQVPCPCGNESTSTEVDLVASRSCRGDFRHGAMWKEPNVMPCNISDLAREICRLTELEPSERVIGLFNLTDDDSYTPDTTDVTIITKVLLTTETAVRGNLMLTESYLSVVDNILGIDINVLTQSQAVSKTSARILATVDSIVAEIPLYDFDEPVVIVFENFATSVIEFETEEFEGHSFHFYINSSRIGDLKHKSESSMSSVTGPTVSLPSDLLVSLDNITNTTKVINNLFLNEGFFLRRRNNSLKVYSLIVSSTVVDTPVKDLENPINITFHIDQDDTNINASKKFCAFWDPSLDEGYGDWSDRGCNLAINDDKLVCMCDHLTNFAILLDVSNEETFNGNNNDRQFDQLLGAISYIGVIISIFCVLITLITYIAAKKLRKRISSQLIINLCFALLGLYVSFILAIHSRHIEILCAISGVVLQYFFLVTFLAMGCESIILYRELVIIVGERRSGVALKSALVCWILPIFLVFFCFAPNYKKYINEAFCRAFGIPFYIGTVAPFILIYIFNCIMFSVIIVSLLRRNRSSATTKLPAHVYAKQQVGVAISLSILFGITWGFGLFASQGPYKGDEKYIRDTFAAIFVILTSFHGFGLFIMHCVRPTKVRKEVWAMFKSQKHSTNTILKGKLTTSSRKHAISSTNLQWSNSYNNMSFHSLSYADVASAKKSDGFKFGPIQGSTIIANNDCSGLSDFSPAQKKNGEFDVINETKF